MGLGVSPLLLRPKKKRRHLMCVPFEIKNFSELSAREAVLSRTERAITKNSRYQRERTLVVNAGQLSQVNRG